jgi:drug/metabolite transporter (DMT)-like permease
MSQRVFSYGAGVLFAAAGAACWSMAGGLVRLTEEVDAWQIVFYRSSVVLVCMMVWLGLRFRGDLWARTREAGVNAVIAGVAIGTAGLVFIISMFYTTVADAVFMTGVSPFLSAILGLWILRERIPAITCAWHSWAWASFSMAMPVAARWWAPCSRSIPLSVSLATQ